VCWPNGRCQIEEASRCSLRVKNTKSTAFPVCTDSRTPVPRFSFRKVAKLKIELEDGVSEPRAQYGSLNCREEGREAEGRRRRARNGIRSLAFVDMDVFVSETAPSPPHRAPAKWLNNSADSTPFNPVLSARLQSPTNVITHGASTPAVPSQKSGRARSQSTVANDNGRPGIVGSQLTDVVGASGALWEGGGGRSSPLSPLDSTKKLLQSLVGVGEGVDGEHAEPFAWGKLLEGVSAPAIGSGAHDGRHTISLRRSANELPVLAKLKPRGPPKTLCRDLPKRGPRITKVLETPHAQRMKRAIESEVIQEGRVRREGEEGARGVLAAAAEEEEEEEEGEAHWGHHRHSAPASMLYTRAAESGEVRERSSWDGSSWDGFRVEG
jgi:hypothetical protein